MLIAHVALYTDQLDAMRNFYVQYFNAESNEMYENPATGFQSFFLVFDDGGSRLEIMRRPHITDRSDEPNVGYAHLAISTGSTSGVDNLTERLRKDGYTIMRDPRFTGDGYYESVVLDPDHNEVEITV